jgi:hypothetical protein
MNKGSSATKASYMDFARFMTLIRYWNAITKHGLRLIPIPTQLTLRTRHITYYRILAAQARGDKYADETPSARFREMDNFLDKAMIENKVSMSLISKPSLTHYSILWTAGHYEDRKLERKLLSEGNRIDPKTSLSAMNTF